MASESRGIFFLDAPSASVCLLIQLEKPATEEGGVTPSVYSRKEPVSQPKLKRNCTCLLSQRNSSSRRLKLGPTYFYTRI